MDWTVLGNYSPGLAVAIVCLYFYNIMALKYLEERKEMIQATVAERKEWNAMLEKLTDRYDARLQAAIASSERTAAELHALRGKIQEFLTTVEARFTTIDNMLRGRTGRGHSE